MINELMNGFTSGFVSSFICHPLEFLKIINQNNQNNQNNKINYKKGIIISSVAYGLHYCIYFNVLSQLNKNSINSINSLFVNSFISQGISNVLLNPLWIIRTKRIATDQNYSTLLNYKNFTLKNVTRGNLVSSMLCLQTGISFTVMEILNNNNINPIVSSIIARTLAGSITYPLDTIRTIIRINNDLNTTELMLNLFKKDPFLFYNGFSFYLIKSIPSFVMVNIIYNYLQKNNV